MKKLGNFMDKRKTLGVAAAASLTAVGLMLTTLAFGNNFKASTRLKASDYSLTLNSNNGISGTNVTTTKSITTDSGAYEVAFDYTNCSSYNGGHATINAGGKIVNKDHIRSIYSLVANFTTSGELKFRTSYDGTTWGGYTSMRSLEEYELGSHPYYVEFTTDGTNFVNLTSVQFSYTCEENPDALPIPSDEYQYEKVTSNQEDWSGEYLLVNESTSSTGYAYKGIDDKNGNEYQTVSINNGIVTDTPYSTVALTKMDGGYSMLINGGTNANKYAYGTDANNYMNFGTTASACTVVWSSNNYAEIAWIGSDGNYILRFNDGSNGYAATYQFKFYKPSSSYGGAANETTAASAAVKLYKKVPIETSNIPVDENGFTAVDNNKDNYTTNSIFDSANGLVVKATFTDGSTQTLTKGSTGYSYVVKNSSGAAIDTSAKFPAEDVYTLVVSYKKYIPVEITLNVGVYTYLTGVTPSMTVTTFTTADILSNNIATQLSAALTYNVSSLNKSVNYGNFTANKLAVQLLDPNGVAKSISSAFGTAGTWTLKVYSTEDSSVYGTVSLTVNSIAVVDITLDRSSLTLHVNEEAQLTATVNPTNATNQGIIWSSDDETVATVSETGLVKAKKIGTATITATSSDGGKTATCAITVKKQSSTTATITSNSSGTADQPATISTSSFNTEGIVLTSVTASGSVYYGSDNSFRVGKSKGTGGFEFSFSSTVITGITLHASYYGSDNSVPVKISTSANTTGETVAVTSSSNESYVTTAFASDTNESTTITVETTTNGKRIYFYGITVTCGVTDPVYPTAISLTDSTCNVGYTTQLDPVFTPSDTNQTSLTWTSNNTSAVTVDQNGLVTGVSAGSATITATGEDENGNPVSGSCTVTVTTVAVTGVSLNKTTLDLSKGATTTLEATISPSNASNKNVTWTSSNTSVATVSNGTITGVAVGTTTITVKTVDGNKTASCSVSVVEGPTDDYTIMVYMCGSDLESGTDEYGTTHPNNAGYASGDLDEILSVSGKPSNVNIIVETGGAKAWAKSQIPSNKLARWEIDNGSMVKKEELNNASMGLQSTLQSFLEWGLNTYPAKKMGLIMWNHGGALDGCCYDENFSNDALTPIESYNAIASAKNNCNWSSNLEWIAYDACLMAVQDIAEYNSYNFNYMLSSQESEAGYGYDYDAWLPDLYANTSIDTATLLEKVGHTFIEEEKNLYSQNNWGPCDQTQSVYDLSKMSAYKTAFESFANSLYGIIQNSDSKASALADCVNSAQKYGVSEDDYGNVIYPFDVFDVASALSKIAANSNFSSLSSKATAINNALSQLVVYEEHGTGTTGCGICLFCPISQYTWYYDAEAGAPTTNFTNWKNVANKIAEVTWQ